MQKVFPFRCLWCPTEFVIKQEAVGHCCDAKRASEQRQGRQLATYDPVQRTIEIEAYERSLRVGSRIPDYDLIGRLFEGRV